MTQLTIEDIARSALAATNHSEIAHCYIAAEGNGYHSLTDRHLIHPLTGQSVTLGQILAAAYLELAPVRMCPACTRSVHTCDGWWTDTAWAANPTDVRRCGCLLCTPELPA